MFRSNSDVVTWEKNGRVGKCKHGTVYCLEVAVEKQLIGEITRMITNQPIWFEYSQSRAVSFRTDIFFETISMTYPVIPLKDRYPLLKEIQRLAHLIALKLFDKKGLEEELSDYEFLGRLGRQRNWREQCAVCLEENFMGTTCSCGHTEVVIFRPCGHSLCANPCFYDLMKTENVVLQDTEITIDEKKFFIPGKKNIDLQTNFPCPLCRRTVVSTFRAESVFPKNLLDGKLEEAVIAILPKLKT